MANSYALACASGVEWVPLEYSSMSNARERQLDRWQYTRVGLNSMRAIREPQTMLCLVLSLHAEVNHIITFQSTLKL
jgi:hypothetical protein